TLTTYIADTHSLVWYLGSPPRLGPFARHAFAEAVASRARIIIPVIVLAEIIFAVERGKIRADVPQLIHSIRSASYFRVVPLRLVTILRLQTLTEIPEMHDRILVAETLARKASLITRDQAITNSRIVATVW
ncbi:MAG: PIN domain-containing protein, partial [Candidatus Tectomicrobia bacterium]|nr:PIN domain-containing protein [Candidatus Tectomicrobia bacterium]